MIAKFSRCSRRSWVVFLTILVLLACVGAVVGTNVAKLVHLDRSEGGMVRGFQGKRSLRNFVETSEDDVDLEERTITDTVKKVAQAAKNKLTSNNQATTNKLFKKVQVKETDGKLFQSTQFKEWATTVTKNFKKNTELAQASMVSTLTRHFGDEPLAKLLATAKQNYKSKTVADQLENAQLQNWANVGKTEDDIFALLKLNDKGEKLFESPVAATWMSYVSKLNTQNPDEVIFSSLKKLHNDEALAKMIAGAKNSASTNAMTKKLEQVQLNKWKGEGKSVDDIFAFLKLNNQGEKLLQSPMLNTWISYVDLLKKNPYDLVMVKLSTHYDETALAKMLVAAKQDGQTSRIARKLEEVQFKNWQSDGKTAGDVFKILQFNKEGNKLFTSSMWSVWVSYLTKLNKENPDELMFMALKSQYSDKGVAMMVTLANKDARTKSIGRKLEEELWRSQGKDGDDIFKLLELDRKGINFFDSPALSTWISYVTKLDKLDKKTPDAIAQLGARVGSDMELAKMIGFAKQKASTETTKKGATELQDLQFNKWLARGETPSSVSAVMVNARFDTRNAKVILDYHTFVNAARTG